MIDLTTARELMRTYLRRTEREMDAFGSALAANADRPRHHLVITDEQEHDFGWVFFYNTKEFAESNDYKHALAGNAPLIVDRADGQMYITGTAGPLNHYIEEYRRGVRRRA